MNLYSSMKHGYPCTAKTHKTNHHGVSKVKTSKTLAPSLAAILLFFGLPLFAAGLGSSKVNISSDGKFEVNTEGDSNIDNDTLTIRHNGEIHGAPKLTVERITVQGDTLKKGEDYTVDDGKTKITITFLSPSIPGKGADVKIEGKTNNNHGTCQTSEFNYSWGPGS